MTEKDMELLKDVIQSDIMSKDVSEFLFMTKKSKVNKIHPYQITPPKTDKDRWMTYIKVDGVRKKLVAQSEKELIYKLYPLYYEDEKHTLQSIYDEWLLKREKENVSDRTIQRNKNHWTKYYESHELTKKPLPTLSPEKIEDYFHSIIRKYGMTTKELNNMKFIMKDMLSMAKRNGYIEVNPWHEVDIKTYGCKPPKKSSDKSKIYLPSEKELMFNQLNNDLQDNPHITDSYAIFLLFKLGLRIGEVVAIKEEDINLHEKTIHIHRTETLELNHNDNLRPVVVNHTKKKSHYGDRYLPLSDYDITIIRNVQKVNKIYGYVDSGYLFLDKKGRTKIREIDNRIRKFCRQAKIPEKSAHDIRRTVASEMYMKKVPVEIIRDFLGHSDIKTTHGYIFDCNEAETTANLIKNSLADMNGLRIS